jgi:nucleotide-binding universal stress UspA family protein
MPERIVLAIDGGSASLAAIDWTLTRAALVPVEVRLLTIDDSPRRAGPLERLNAVRALGRAAGRFAEVSAGSKIEMLMLHGDVVECLEKESQRADLIVVGASAVGALAGAFDATVPLKLAPLAACPVVIVPVGWRPSSGPIVVGVDEPTSTSAHEFAAREAERLNRDLVMVRAWQLPPTITPESSGSGAVDESIREAEARILAGALSTVGRGHSGVAVTGRLSYDSPARALAAEAEDRELVVVGTHHRRTLAEWMLGSVGHDLVMRLPCPVAIVPEAAR